MRNELVQPHKRAIEGVGENGELSIAGTIEFEFNLTLGRQTPHSKEHELKGVPRMKQIFVWAIVCAMATVLVASSVSAYPAFAAATGKPCGYCHIDPNGGGPLTAAGTYYASHGTLPPAAPNAPTGLTASSASTSQISLSWTDNSSDETGFYVERSTSSGGTFTQIASLGAGVTTYSNTGLAASTTYYYRVCAYNAGGNSTYSNTASATTDGVVTPPPPPPPSTPADPTGLSAAATSATQINLGWTDNSTDETGFKLERATAAAGPFTQIATLGAGVTTYNNTGLTASTTYYYRVCSYNTAGNSGYATASATTQAVAPPPTPVPAAPTGLTASAASTSQINLGWTDASSNETGFKVERGASASGPFSLIATLGAGVTSYNNTGCAASTTYFYRVCAYNATGNSGYTSVASATTSGTTQPPPPQPATGAPTAPSGLAANGAARQITLTWTDASSDEVGFRIERSLTETGNFAIIAMVGAGVTTHTNMGLMPSRKYYYRVRAYNRAGSSDYSNTASATTTASPVPLPVAPSRLQSLAVSSNQILIHWMCRSRTQTGFRVERAADESGPFTEIATVTANQRSFRDTGLTESTTYYYRVCSYNTGGESDYSNITSSTTRGNTGDEGSGDESDGDSSGETD